MENAKKNLVFHFGVGRQAAFYRIDYVKNISLCPPIKNMLQADAFKSDGPPFTI